VSYLYTNNRCYRNRLLLRCADCSFQHSSWEFCINFQHLCSNSSQLSKNGNNNLVYLSIDAHGHVAPAPPRRCYLPFVSFLATLAEAGPKLALFTPQPAIHHPHQFHQLGRVDVCMDRKHFFITFLSNS
jgi:hypothetical protein